MSTTTRVTADQLLRMPDDGYRHELVAGELRKMVPAGWRHGAAGGNLHSLLGHHVMQHDLGQVFFAETGFLLARDPDTAEVGCSVSTILGGVRQRADSNGARRAPYVAVSTIF